jgi:uncharacterized protein (TIGR02246 family)
MKCFLIFVASFITVSNLMAQPGFLADSAKILGVIENWNTAWKTKDYILASKDYSQDAVFTNAFGDKCNGRVQVEALLKKVFALPFVMAGQSETVGHDFQKLNDSIVIVHTSVIRKGQKLPDGSRLADRQTTHMRVLENNSGTWIIKSHLISDARDKQIPAH